MAPVGVSGSLGVGPFPTVGCDDAERLCWPPLRNAETRLRVESEVVVRSRRDIGVAGAASAVSGDVAGLRFGRTTADCGWEWL